MSKQQSQDTSAGQPGLVISYFGNSVAVEAADGQVFQCHLRRNQQLPVVGDRVLWELQPDNTGLVLQILPRQTVLDRGDVRGNAKPIAANVDVMIIVMAPPPIFSEQLIDRYIIASELLGISPIVVVNKVDLLDATKRAEAEKRLMTYRNIPYPSILTSAITTEGLTDLVKQIEHKTSVLVGPSGVGKSSIISALVKQDIRVNDVSPKGAGKHTTTATRLYHFSAGGNLIDSPGVRDFHLWSVSEAEVMKGFKEFKDAMTGCKFRNCKHLVEPGCAVQAAVADGKISPLRFENYQVMMKNAAKNAKQKYD